MASIAMTASTVIGQLRGTEREAQRALHDLYLELSPRILASLRVRRVDHADAAEIVQDTFMRIWAARMNIPAEANLAAYVWCAARNVWIDRYRNRKLRDSEAKASAMTHELRVPEDADSAANISCLEAAFQCFQAQEPERAHAIELVATQGLDHHGLAEALGKSTGAAREYLSQARRAFAATYEELCGG